MTTATKIDRFPVRLTGGRFAVLELPDPFTKADAERVHKWIALIADVDTMVEKFDLDSKELKL